MKANNKLEMYIDGIMTDIMEGIIGDCEDWRTFDEIRKNNIIIEMIVIIFWRLVKLDILLCEDIDDIYRNILQFDLKDRPYELLKIYVCIELQQLYLENIISLKQLNEWLPNDELTRSAFEYYPIEYNLLIDEHPEKFVSQNILSKKQVRALYEFASNVNVNEMCVYEFYNMIINCNEDEIESEVKNLIVRLKIRELRNNEIITKNEEAMFMSKIRESELTYEVFNWKEIEDWKSRAYASPLIDNLKK